MRLKYLEAALSSITREFPSPNVSLEQYPTSPHLAASVIRLATESGDLGEDKICLDLGCGTGMLSVAAAFVCPAVLAIDCDAEALLVAHENVQTVELEDTVHFLMARVRLLTPTKTQERGTTKSQHRNKTRDSGGRGGRKGRGVAPGISQSATDTRAVLILDGEDGIPLADNSVDTVLTNPPFGTKHNPGIDVQFLRTACRLARRAVYSFHKRSTRTFLLKLLDEWGYQATVAAEMAFDIPQMYKFHNQKTKDVEVDLIRVDILSKGSSLAGEIQS